ncbi:Conserved hypothetical protein [gamma proteobacterium HdN1]|nr:Conserved hypothetical protein [gamma proteobacterium HdN1]
MTYTVVQLIHLFCAITFIGVVFFEVFLLEGVRAKLGPQLMHQVEQGIIGRAKFIMPWFVGMLFISGITLAGIHYANNPRVFSTPFGIMLGIKIVLAISVLVHFVKAMTAAQSGCMDSTRFQYTHLSVFIHMILIVILAKVMFVIHW